MQGGAPYLAKLVCNSNNQWFMLDISILTIVYKHTYNWGGAPPCGSWTLIFSAWSTMQHESNSSNLPTPSISSHVWQPLALRAGALVEGVEDQNGIHQAIVVELTHQFHLSHLDKDVERTRCVDQFPNGQPWVSNIDVSVSPDGSHTHTDPRKNCGAHGPFNSISWLSY